VAVYEEGDEVPWRSRRENQPVTVTRRAWHELHERLHWLEEQVVELLKDEHQ
jgi:hypothetical protein